MRSLWRVFAVALVGLPSLADAQTDSAPPFAFPPEAVSFSNGVVRLAGAFLKPAGEGPFPAVVIVHGAGPATLDEPAFRVHANAFVRGGFAVLLYDKRGSGKSGGVLDTADYDDLAGDLGAGVKFLRARRDVIPGKIGILGRSEGGWIGTLAASRDRRLAFVILSSGCAVRPSEQTLFATAASLRAMGASAEEIRAATAAKAALWEFYRRVANRRGAPSPAIEAERDSLQTRLRSFARFAPQIPQDVRDPSTTPPSFFRAFTRRIDYDPAPAFRKSRAALLEVIGENDDVVEPASTIAAFERMRRSGRDVTVRVLPGVGHSLVVMTKEGPRYPDDYPEFAVRWARERTDNLRPSAVSTGAEPKRATGIAWRMARESPSTVARRSGISAADPHHQRNEPSIGAASFWSRMSGCALESGGGSSSATERKTSRDTTTLRSFPGA